ncbi:TRAP transporter substrate-binding protein DctP [Vibrio sp. SS-MA-C1-2]|uniref:TRAP transporter substrate-binding protein DctP n=1 Tax=Vibrio sp. SS-MA-C1-2 TaxID=2908646 RepID=UPI001F4736D3|nr:TRAP transporter substrate-binding protein DctP [Vibrio sp. SS-MA-C1-2]UJF17622.1 TRAP transporter substrate-binding protein DctP [Vibrio sp. SS-MA-C1-2]
MNLKKALLLTSVCLAFSTTASAKLYKFATNIPSDGAPGVLLQEFADNVKAETDGRVKFKIFWNGTLGNQSDYLQKVQSGVISLGMTNTATLENIAPEIGVLNLPYVFRSLDEYNTTMFDENVKTQIDDALSAKGLNPLGFLSNGFRGIMTSKEIKTMADLKGLKIRTMGSENYIKMLEFFGAVPSPMAFSEVYPALQQGVIDGAEGGVAALWEIKYGEVTKYGTHTNHTRLSDYVVFSDKFKTKVSPEDFKIVSDEFNKVSHKSLTFVDDSMANSEQIAIDKLGVKINDIDIDPFVKAVQPMYQDAMNDPAKKDLLNTIFALQGRN